MTAKASSPGTDIISAYHALLREVLEGGEGSEGIEQIGRRLLAARVPLTAVRDMHEQVSTLLAHSGAAYDLTDEISQALLGIYDRAMADLFELREELQEEVRARRADDADKRAERQALESANTRLKHWIEELRHFNHSLAHDLKAPIRTASAYVDVYLEDNASHLGDRAPLDIARTQLDQLGDRIDAVLEHATVLGREQTHEPVDLNELLKQVLAALRTDLEHTKADVAYDPLPQINGDRFQLHVLLLNLLGNAIKYREPSRPLTIEIRNLPTPNAQTVSFAVSDNGIGIDKGHLKRIFESFARVRGTHSQPGTGLGLAMCATVCERHGGRIDAQSGPGLGSTFTVILGRE
ncbi:MAG: ATP-binding protein [Pseudomonadota bacterium]